MRSITGDRFGPVPKTVNVMNTLSKSGCGDLSSAKDIKVFLYLLFILILNMLFADILHAFSEDYDTISGKTEFQEAEDILAINNSDKTIKKAIINLPDGSSRILDKSENKNNK